MSEIEDLFNELYEQVDHANHLHGPFNSSHEAYAVIKEELDEYWDEVKKKSHKRDRSEMKKELLQIAASAIKAIQSMEMFAGPIEPAN